MIESLKQRGHKRKIGSVQATAQSHPGLQWSGESGINETVPPWKALSEQNLATIRAPERAFLLPAQFPLQKDNSALLAFVARIGRLSATQHANRFQPLFGKRGGIKCHISGTVDAGDEILLEFVPVTDVLPAELQELLVANRDFASEWAKLAPGRKRQLAEWVAGAKQPSTRARRASLLVSGRCT